MIVNAFIGVVATVFGGLLSAVPGYTFPAWFDGHNNVDAGAGHTAAFGNMAWTIGDRLSGLQGWIDFQAFGNVLAAVLVALGVTVGIRSIRLLLSLLTGGGGSVS
jgi:hypothetical protein